MITVVIIDDAEEQLREIDLHDEPNAIVYIRAAWAHQYAATRCCSIVN